MTYVSVSSQPDAGRRTTNGEQAMKYTTKQVRGGHAAFRVSTKGGIRFFSTLKAAARFATRAGRASVEMKRTFSKGNGALATGAEWVLLPLGELV